MSSFARFRYSRPVVRFAALLIGALTFLPSVFAQEPQWWTDQKRTCRLPSNLAYNDWVQSGSPCNSGSAGGGGTALPAAPSGATLQQQMALSAAQAAMPYLQQMVHNFFYGSPTNQPVVDPAQQQRFLAAEQLNNSGIYLFKQKNYAGAINEFQKALEQTPNDANIINNLALAKQQLNIQQLNGKAAAQTSGALGQLLGNAPANTGNLNFDQLTHSSITNPNASTLNLVNLGSDAGTVDLRNATKTSVDPQSLKNQIDGVLTNRAPASEPPSPQIVPPQAQDIELLFQPPQSTLSQFPGPQRPADSPKLVNPMDAQEQTKAQVEAIFAQPGGLDDILEKQALGVNAKPASNPPLKDAVKDSSDQKTGTRTGVFGTKSPSNPDLGGVSQDVAIPAHSVIEQGSSAAKSGKDATAAGSIEETKHLSNCQFDEAGCRTPGAINIPRPGSQQNSKPVPAAVANSAGYKDLQRQKENLEKKYQELDTKLMEIRQQQASGQGDQGALAMEASKIKNEQTAVRSEGADVGRKMDDLSVTFQEETQPAKKPGPSIAPPPPPQ
jgi:ribosomal protein L29